jgi:hypothetical protein
MTDSNYWGPPRHDLPMTHATPNPTDSYHDPGIGGGGWNVPVNTAATAYSGGSAAPAIGGSIGPTKRSMVLAVVLAFLLGPFGLFYVSVLTGIVALVVLPIVVPFLASAVAMALDGGTDVGSVAVPILWCIAIPWAAIGVRIRNARIDRARERSGR